MRLVVAVHVGTHRQFRRVLGRVQQRQDLGGVGDRVDAARDGAGDRAGLDPAAFDPDIHFRRGRDQELALAKIDQCAIGGGVGAAQPAEQGGRAARGFLGEDLAQDDFEQVAALEGVPRLLDRGGVVAGPVVVGRFGIGAGGVRRGGGGARQTVRPLARRRELVMVDRGGGAQMIHHQDLVRQIEHEVALVAAALQPSADRFELERQIVAERAVEPQGMVVRRAEQVGDRPQDREDGGLPAAVFFGEGAGGCLLDPAVDPSRSGLQRFQRVQAGEILGDGADQDPAAQVQRLDPDVAVMRGQHHRRIDEAQVPPGIASRIFEAGGQQHAAPPLQRIDQRFDRAVIGLPDQAAFDPDAAARPVVQCFLVVEAHIRVPVQVSGQFSGLAGLTAATDPRCTQLRQIPVSDKNKGRPEPMAATMSITAIACVSFGRPITRATTNAALL